MKGRQEGMGQGVQWPQYSVKLGRLCVDDGGDVAGPGVSLLLYG